MARIVSARAGSLSAVFLIQTLGLALPLPFVLADAASGGLEADWGAAALWGALSAAFLSAGYLCYYTGLRRGAVAVVTSSASAWLAVTVVASVALFGERVSAWQAALMGGALAGILMLSAQPTTRSGGGAGLQWGLGAMAGIGLALAFLDRVTEASEPMLAVLIVRALSAIPTFLLIRSRRESIRLPGGPRGRTLLLAAAALDAGGYAAYNLGVDAAPVALVAPIAAAHPVVTVALAVALLRERPRALQWAGAGVTVAAIIGLSAFTGA